MKWILLVAMLGNVKQIPVDKFDTIEACQEVGADLIKDMLSLTGKTYVFTCVEER